MADVRATHAFFASRAMQALEILAFGESSATRIADELRVHPRTARRLLNRMVVDGWLVRNDGPRPSYAPTLRMLALSAHLADRTSMFREAVEPARALAAATGQSVHLAIPSYRSTLRVLAVVDGRSWSTRDLAPAHMTAAGKVLLAWRAPWRASVLAVPLRSSNGEAIDPRALKGDLERALARGWAVERKEYRTATSAVAVPIEAPAGDPPVAALALAGHGEVNALVEHVEDVRETARAIAQAINETSDEQRC